MKKNILCIGQTVFDVQIKGIDFSKEIIREVKQAEKIQIGVGGDATNQAIVLSRLGFNVKLISSLGNDSAGFFLKKKIATTSVNIEDVIEVQKAETPISIVLIDSETGERSFIFAGGVTVMMQGDLIPPNLEAIKGKQVVSFGSMFGSPLHDKENISTILETAKSEGAIVCADIIVFPGQNRLAEMGDVLSYIDFLFPNEDECRMFTGKDTLDEMADVILGYGVKHVVIKRGRKGCFLKSKDVCFTVPAFLVNAVDTTGAGDNFVAGFITALMDKKPLDECCRFACATAAVNIMEMGANTGVNSKEQVLQFMADFKPV